MATSLPCKGPTEEDPGFAAGRSTQTLDLSCPPFRRGLNHPKAGVLSSIHVGDEKRMSSRTEKTAEARSRVYDTSLRTGTTRIRTYEGKRCWVHCHSTHL